MKKFLLILALLCLAFTLISCGKQPQAQADRTPPISNVDPSSGLELPPSPPPPEGVEKVFGKRDVTVLAISDCLQSDCEQFMNGVQDEAKALGLTCKVLPDVSFSDIDKQLQGIDAIVVYASGENNDYQDLIATGLPVSVFQKHKGDIPPAVSSMLYNSDSELLTLLDAALAYPPHDTPVRLIGIFEKESSAMSEEFQALYKQGKVLPKQVHYGNDKKTSVIAFMYKLLGNYFEGMVDGIVAENPKLALEALGVLETEGRTDMELFVQGSTNELATRLSKSGVTVIATSVDEYALGRAQLLIAAGMLKGAPAIAKEIQPALIPAEQGAPPAGLDLAEYEQPWMKELRDYYAKK